MSLPPNKPKDPFNRGQDGRPERKGSADGPGGNQGNTSGASSSGSHSSSTKNVAPTLHADEDGYDSSTDLNDLPKNYFEIMSRERDRKKNNSRENRKLNRYLAANGWPQDEPVHPGSFVRAYHFQYSQKGNQCKTTCAAFIQRRFFGEDVNAAIHGLKSGHMALNIPRWTDFYQSRESDDPREAPASIKSQPSLLQSFNLHTLITRTIKSEEPSLHSSNRTALNPTANRVPAGHPRFDVQFYEKPIGRLFPDSDPSDQGSLSRFPADASYDSRGLPTSSDVLPSRKATGSMQQALFSAMQPSKLHGLPVVNPGNADAIPATRMRCATPFVVLCLTFFSSSGVQVNHEIVVDFSEPARPGIFDPNFGWMEPAQGFCILRLEMALISLWQFYSSQKMGINKRYGFESTRMAGLFWLDRGPTDNDRKYPTRVPSFCRCITSSQIYVDVTPIPTSPVITKKNPPLKS